MKNKFFPFISFFSFWVMAIPFAAWSQETSPSVSPTPTASPATMVTPMEGDSLPAKPTPESVPGYRNYSFVHVDGPYIAVTFDDGPSQALTPRLLDMLKQRGVKATFFVIGENVTRSPEIVARAAAEGHEIGNHTWSHPALTKLSNERVQEEIGKTSDAIFQATGKKPTLLRPPYGAINPRLSRMIEQQDGLTIILWSVDPLDWKRPGSSVVAQRLLAGAKPGAITLSHDIQPGTIEAMPAVLDALKAKGYQFVTVSELIALESKTPPLAEASKSAISPRKKRTNK